MIGILVVLGLLNNCLTASVSDQWGYLFIPIVVQGIFIVVFFMNKASGDKDNYKWRNLVFKAYLFGVIGFNSLYDLIMVFLGGQDTATCGNALIPWCPALYRGWTVIQLVFCLSLELYFAACLKYWADNKKEDKQYTIL